MSTPAGYSFWPPSWEDLEGVTAVLTADQVAAAGTSTLDSDFIRNRWSHPSFDISQDAWVIVDGNDRVIGYGMVALEDARIARSWGVVLPDHRGCGLGSALFDRIDHRAGKLLAGVPDAQFRHAINAGDQAAEKLLRARGLRLLRHFWHMEAELVGPMTPEDQPTGIDIAPIRYPDDLRAVHDILDSAFQADPSHQPEPFDSWLEGETGAPGFDGTLWLLARERDAPVGTLTASIANGIGWVDYLGVLARARGRGVGAALLRRAFATLADRGVRTVRLNVDAENATGATALYERVGMRVVWGWDLWERRAGPQPTAANPRTTETSSSTA
jgi:mycothiol synthase